MQFVAFLRAINTGNRRVKMVDLARVFSENAYKNVATHIASGNVIFDSPSPPDSKHLEHVIEQGVGFHSQVFIRSADQVRSVLERVPWNREDAIVDVSFLERSPDPAAASVLEATVTRPEELVVSGAEVYFLRVGREPTTHKELSVTRILGMNTTRRGLRTIEQICERLLR